jgi:hypothetical protein
MQQQYVTMYRRRIAGQTGGFSAHSVLPLDYVNAYQFHRYAPDRVERRADNQNPA